MGYCLASLPAVVAVDSGRFPGPLPPSPWNSAQLKGSHFERSDELGNTSRPTQARPAAFRVRWPPKNGNLIPNLHPSHSTLARTPWLVTAYSHDAPGRWACSCQSNEISPSAILCLSTRGEPCGEWTHGGVRVSTTHTQFLVLHYGRRRCSDSAALFLSEHGAVPPTLWICSQEEPSLGKRPFPQRLCYGCGA